MLLAAAAVAPTSSSARSPRSRPYLVVENVHFRGPDCSVVGATITNYGEVEQPAGWSISYAVRKLDISQTFYGQQALAAGASRYFFSDTGIATPGHYRVRVSVGDTDAKTKAAGSTLIPQPGDYCVDPGP